MLRRFRKIFLLSLLNLAEILLKGFLIISSPILFLAQCFEVGLTAAVTTKIREHSRLINGFKNFLARNLLGRTVFRPIVFALLTSLELLVRVLILLLWPVLYLAHIIEENSQNIDDWPPQAKRLYWLRRWIFGP